MIKSDEFCLFLDYKISRNNIYIYIYIYGKIIYNTYIFILPLHIICILFNLISFTFVENESNAMAFKHNVAIAGDGQGSKRRVGGGTLTASKNINLKTMQGNTEVYLKTIIKM